MKRRPTASLICVRAADTKSTMSKWRKWIGLAVVLVFVGAGVCAAIFGSTSKYHSSPTAERSHDRPMDSWSAFHAKLNRRGAPVVPFPEVQVWRRNGQLIIDEGNRRRIPRVPREGTVADLVADESCAIDFPTGERQQLLAYAVSVQGTPNGTTLSYVHPLTRVPIPTEEVASWSIPPVIHFDSPLGLPASTLRLVFASDGLPFVHAEPFAVFDSRTQTNVGGNFQNINATGVTCWDVPLYLWHDTPVTLIGVAPHGEPEVRAIELGESFQVPLEQGGWFQLISAGAGELKSEQWYLGADTSFVDEEKGFHLVYRLEAGSGYPSCFLEIDDDGRVDRHWCAESPEVLQKMRYVHYPRASPPLKLRLVTMPNQARFRIELPGLTGMPNGPDVTNLFDVRLPYFDTPNSPVSPPPVMFLNAIGRVAQMDARANRLQMGSNQDSRSYTNVTAGQLLRNFERETGWSVEVDSEFHRIRATPPPSRPTSNWWDRIRAWFR